MPTAQVGWMLERISAYMGKHPPTEPNTRYDIIDVGGGRGDMALNAAVKYGYARVTGGTT